MSSARELASARYRRMRRRLRPDRPAVAGDFELVDVGNGVLFNIPRRLQERPADLVTMGRRSYMTPHVQWHAGDSGRLRVGSFSCVHSTVTIFVGGEHNPRWVTQYPLRAAYDLPGAWLDGQPRTRGDVVIGSDVYVGFGCTILSGVTIGDGAIVGAGSVVTRSVDPYAIVAGSPAIFKRWRFEEADRTRLLNLRWWDWADEKIVANADLMSSDRITEFLDAHAPND